MAKLPPGVSPIEEPLPQGVTPAPPPPSALRRGWDALGRGLSGVAGGFLAPVQQLMAGDPNPIHLMEAIRRGGEQPGRLATTIGEGARNAYLTAPLVGLGSAAGDFASSVLGSAPKLLPAAGRVVGSALGGGTQAAIEEQPIAPAAVKSGLAAGIMEGAHVAVPKGVDLARKGIAKFTGSEAAKQAAAAEANVAAKATEQTAADMAKRTLASQEAHRIGTQAGKVIPGLGVKSGADLHALTAGGEGRKILNQQYSTAVDAVSDALKANRITKIKVPELSDQPMTLREALDQLQLVGKGMGQAPPSARSVGQRFAALDYGKAREALISRLNDLVPGAGDQMSRAMQTSSQGRFYLKLIGKSLDASGQLDPVKLVKNVNKETGDLVQRFGPKAQPMMQVLTGGRQMPMSVPGKLVGEAWRPPTAVTAPTRGLSPDTMIAIDAIASQPGGREAVIGGAFLSIPSILGRLPGGHYILEMTGAEGHGYGGGGD